MAITDDKKVDFLWKKVIFGAAETTARKAGSNEAIGSPLPTYGHLVWAQSGDIPIPAPESDSTIVAVFKDASALKLIPDPTVNGNYTWLALVSETGDAGDSNNRHKDWISPSFDPSYLVTIYNGHPAAGGEKLNSLTEGVEWVFDYQAGVLHFPNNVPAGIGDLYLEGYRYTGSFGAGSGSPDGGVGGGSDFLGLPTDGEWDNSRIEGGKPPAVTNWNSATRTADAIDDLNEILGLLLPDTPPSMSEKTLSLQGGASSKDGDKICLSDGAPNDINAAVSAGDQIYRVGGLNVTTNTITEFGSGNSGILKVVSDGADVDFIALTAGDDTGDGVNGILSITRDVDYPVETPGFWQAIDARATVAHDLVGVHSIKMVHTDTGETNEVVYLAEIPTTSPVTTIDGLSEVTANVVMSSGVPHYTDGSVMGLSFSSTPLSSHAYLDGGILQMSSNPSAGSVVSVGPGEQGIPSIPTINLNHSVVDLPYALGGNLHGETKLRVRGRNPDHNGDWVETDESFMVMTGNPTVGLNGPIQEMNIKVSSSLGVGTGNAVRVKAGDGDTPVYDVALTASDWDSTTTPQLWEAIIARGKAQHSVEDFSLKLPEGPDFAPKSADQYVTFMFHRSAVSKFMTRVKGTYSGMWVRLVGTNGLKGTLNGWWDMFTVYDGAGIPDSGSNSPGCALGAAATGSTGDFVTTFGAETSSNSSNNVILVRFKLVAGDEITGLEFKEA